MTSFKMQNSSFSLDFLFGGLAATISKTMIAPLERVKLLLQTQDSNKRVRDGRVSKYTGISNCLYRVTREEGVGKLWRGNLTNVLRYFPTQALNFALKDTLRQWFCPYNAKKDPFKFFVGSLTAGGFAGGISLFFVYPLDFARTRLGADIYDSKYGRQFEGTRDCIQKVYKVDGVRGLYKGFGVSVVGIFIYRAFYFGGFDTAKKIFFEDFQNQEFRVKFLVAQSVTAFAGFISYPLDTVKRRLMMQSGGKEILYKGTIDCIVTVSKKEGSRALFKGGYSNFLRGIGASLVLVLYDEMHTRLGFNSLAY